ncbi:hypothetical protein [Bradyrhizobium sp. URHD0069]|uniref:hypothetical protein n=1 Tax=Bradyrhizobium sp. URHD0069 TaxID=1380355 RepID=UPI0012DE4A5E|nr:hypothetical protein [Bradyrhizobium sp. URHD0069]
MKEIVNGIEREMPPQRPSKPESPSELMNHALGWLVAAFVVWVAFQWLAIYMRHKGL